MRTKWLVVGLGALIIVLLALLVLRPQYAVAPEPITPSITTFEECQNAGYPLLEIFPEQCIAPSGEVYTRIVEDIKEETTPLPIKQYEEFNTDVTLKIADEILFTDGLILTLKEINDSRCNPEVQCIWAGELSAVFLVSGGDFDNMTTEVRLGTMNNTSTTVAGYVFTLTHASTTQATVVVLKNSPTASTSNGYVRGHVSIGPICPVERIDNPCVVPPEMYTSRNVVVYESDAVTIKEKTALDAHGNYSIELNAGTYWIQIQPAGIGDGEKKKVVVTADKTQTLDFAIDTGIR